MGDVDLDEAARREGTRRGAADDITMGRPRGEVASVDVASVDEAARMTRVVHCRGKRPRRGEGVGATASDVATGRPLWPSPPRKKLRIAVGDIVAGEGRGGERERRR